ncbi:MAG: helix-hairpin-helix domain-containing protein [Bacteroidales bacterium]|nr:helix-hairpin-helix domain-containing protein [Bacteroidales bacterium]MDZ4204023.1 helix-hairpin-helix domain-containing protein [Bacteroidales bacterium]
MRNVLKDYFSFSSRDIRGIYILLGILIVLLIFKKLPVYFVKNTEPDFTQFEKNVLILEKARHAMQEQEKKQSLKGEFDFNRSDYSAAKQKLNPFPFDPNNMTELDWLRLGLSERQVRGIMNYITKGGAFRKKEDVKKLYSISASEYEILEPFIVIRSREEKTFKSTYGTDVKAEKELAINRPLININTADSIALVRAKGIGPAFARRIIRYRDQLGGFHSSSQLLEVYGLDSTRYEMIKDALFFDESELKKININKASVEEMSRHPYIDFYLAKSLIDHRIKSGKILSVEETSTIPFMHDSRYRKLFPYLTTE